MASTDIKPCLDCSYTIIFRPNSEWGPADKKTKAAWLLQVSIIILKSKENLQKI